MLDSLITNTFSGIFDADLVPQESGELQALAPFVASWLCNSGGNLLFIKQDIEKLMAHDPQAIQEINNACNWDWDEDLAHLAALDAILAECQKALSFRIDWESKHFQDDMPKMT